MTSRESPPLPDSATSTGDARHASSEKPASDTVDAYWLSASQEASDSVERRRGATARKGQFAVHPLSQSDIHRFKEKVNRSGSCHNWTAHTDLDGYGHFWLHGGNQQAHRIAYLIENGELPEVVQHTCDNPPCVNPDHLRSGIQAENIRDRQARDRQAKGSRNDQGKPGADDVLRMRRLKAEPETTYRELADQYNVSPYTVKDAVRGDTWGQLPIG